MMNRRFERKTLLEALGALGVVASLVFVGLEVRQSTRATRAATVLELKQGWTELNLVLMQNPQLLDALLEVARDGFDAAAPHSQLVVASWFRTILHNWSNAYFQYRVGTLDDDQWAALVRDMEGESRRGVVWGVWDRWGYIYDEPFRALMDSLRTANYDPDAVYAPPGPEVPAPGETTVPAEPTG